MKAKVKWFSTARRYGYLTSEDGQDYFVHASGIASGRTYMGFDEGDVVEFDPVVGKKGPMATNVKLVEMAEPVRRPRPNVTHPANAEDDKVETVNNVEPSN